MISINAMILATVVVGSIFFAAGLPRAATFEQQAAGESAAILSRIDEFRRAELAATRAGNVPRDESSSVDTKAEATLDATPLQVFSALTEPAIIQKWEKSLGRLLTPGEYPVEGRAYKWEYMRRFVLTEQPRLIQRPTDAKPGIYQSDNYLSFEEVRLLDWAITYWWEPSRGGTKLSVEIRMWSQYAPPWIVKLIGNQASAAAQDLRDHFKRASSIQGASS